MNSINAQRRSPRKPRHTGRRALVATAVSAVLLALPVGSKAQTAPRTIDISGVISDPAGHPLPEVTVVFEAARRGLSLRGLRMETGKTEERRAVTNQRGLYTVHWPYDPFFNHFEVRVEIPVRKPDGEHSEILAHAELSNVGSGSNPVVANLTVQRAELLRSLKEFLAQIDTADERSVYQKMGKPDEVDRHQASGQEESAWWYFEAGKVFFFQSGKLQETRQFTPVRPF